MLNIQIMASNGCLELCKDSSKKTEKKMGKKDVLSLQKLSFLHSCLCVYIPRSLSLNSALSLYIISILVQAIGL